jgi:hypothetical protein
MSLIYRRRPERFGLNRLDIGEWLGKQKCARTQNNE